MAEAAWQQCSNGGQPVAIAMATEIAVMATATVAVMATAMAAMAKTTAAVCGGGFGSARAAVTAQQWR